MAANLDLLCDMLEAELSDDENEPEEEPSATPLSTTRPIVEESRSSAPDKVVAKLPEEIAEPIASMPNPDVASLEAQMKAMKEQMERMQKLLDAKSAVETSESTSKTLPTVREINLFQPSSGALKAAGPRSPVKTNPFEDSDKPRRSAQLYQNTPRFGPALPNKTSRVLQGEEKAKILARLDTSDRTKLEAVMVRGDLQDSSDDEAERNPMEQKYNEYGKSIKKRLSKQTDQAQPKTAPLFGFNQVQGSSLNLSQSSKNKPLPKDLVVEKQSKLRISNPTISQSALDVQFLGKTFVPIYKMKEMTGRSDLKGGDWATVGVITYKTINTSKNGNSYTMWSMTDLFGQIKQIKVMLFGRTHARHYKIQINRVVALFNPKILEDRSGKGEVSLTIDQDNLTELGDSLDTGKCQGRRQDGTGCTNLVNLASCEFCEFHVKRAYKSMSSKRGDLQSSFSGNGDVRSRLMGKVDPKGELFGGGKFMNAASNVGKMSVQQRAKDNSSLRNLGVTPVEKVFQAEKVQTDPNKIFSGDGKVKFRTHLNDQEKQAVIGVAKGVSSELGLRLLAPTPGARTLIKHFTKVEASDQAKLDALNGGAKETSKGASGGGESSNASSSKSATQLLLEHKRELALEKRRQILHEQSLKQKPQLGRGLGSAETVNLGATLSIDPKKAQALKILQAKGRGQLAKSSPNHLPNRKRKAEDKLKSLEKVRKALNDKNDDHDTARQECHEKTRHKDRLQKVLGQKSKNQNLIEDHENEVLDKHLDSLERVENMEEKMIQTTEIETKAVSCKLCNYTAFSQSDLCKQSGHRIKVISCKKRFFECKQCKNRTISLDKYPKGACSKCGESRWTRTGMMREKKGPLLDSEQLCIRGVEQKFINQTSSVPLHLDSF
ncbi:protein MCM10 homolog [Tigriopus californicus]|uniref:protein MCM10 homolog n=1 Tax=Tigriopus californicus TaxID=6832 RepID=UPI0027DA6096|nr:protein MCM10 homolog [Tigriopus californicus]